MKPPGLDTGVAGDYTRHSAFLNDIRFVYSALTDADFIQTEAHFEGQTPEQLGRDQGPPLSAARILEAVDAEIARARTGRSSESVRLLRHETLADCTAASPRPPGLFTLTAPTGSGKTLAALRFAFAHAAKHNLRRIVYVSPYLTIFDQTVELLGRILLQVGMSLSERQRYLLEHASLTRLDAEIPEHSMRLGDSEHEDRRRLQARLSENWDAPFIATTNVQLLESLFSNRSSKCRKLHRLAGSVIVLDEVQTLPMDLACATLATLSRLAEAPFGCTLLFMTATQPAFNELDSALNQHWKANWRPTEITTEVPRKFSLAKRFRVSWPRPSEALPWSSLANEIANVRSPRQALVIVNVKRHAAELLASLPEEIEARHLSTSMCPRHRKDVLADVHQDLTGGRDCILVATQCVEAGVDLDFPLVFRAMGPLDSIAQAAGRCNRHGNRDFGDFRVFEPPDDALPPDDGYKLGTASTRAMLHYAAESGIDLDDPLVFHAYYSRLYNLRQLARPGGDLFDAIRRHDFPRVAELYRLIDDNTVQVVVPYHPEAFAALEAELHSDGFSAAWIRRARPYTVNVFRGLDGNVESFCVPVLTRSGRPKYIPDWFLLGNSAHYDSKDKKIGLKFPKPGDFQNA